VLLLIFEMSVVELIMFLNIIVVSRWFEGVVVWLFICFVLCF